MEQGYLPAARKLEGDRLTSTRCCSSQRSSSPGSNLTNLPTLKNGILRSATNAGHALRHPESPSNAVDVQ